MIERDWRKCYGAGWQGLIVPDAFAHPAKFSRALIRRIYAHVIEQGYVAPGQCVVDPFGGVALGALHAMQNGLTWCGVELEEKFVRLGEQNIDLWNRRFGALPGWGSAQILQGDSRGLCGVVGVVDGVVGSPPFEESLSGKGKCPETRPDGTPFGQGRSIDLAQYGDTRGNIGTETGETFWTASRQIMEQCHQILKPGGVAVWVVKAFVRNKQVVDFPGQWQQLGEACGFETLEYIRAWLVEDKGSQYDLFGELHTRTVERKSFFRRLYEKKYPHNSIDYEVVLVQGKGC